MRKIVEFDTAIGTSNLGDEIILGCLREEMRFLFDESFIMRFGSHVKNLPYRHYLFGSMKLKFAYDCDFKLIMGTNLLSHDLKKTRAQWPIGNLDSWIYKNSILAGVGMTLDEDTPTKYTRKIYNRILRKDFVHSVRDEESKRFLENMGFQAVNTGCPTLWKFTPEFCAEIPKKKADRVVFSLSGYKSQSNPVMDKKFIEILRQCYDKLYFWGQTSVDEIYLDRFENTEDIERISSLRKFEELLNEGSIDYVGTRLHGGVYALQHKVRSIVIAIDHRARGFHDTNNLPICERDDIEYKLRDMIEGELITDIRVDRDAINGWKEQFLKEYVKTDFETHESLWYVKLGHFHKKFTAGVRRRKAKLKKKVKKFYKKKVKKFFRKYKERIKKKILRILKRSSDAKLERKYAGFVKSLPLEENKIMFFTFQGDYACNPKYISEEMLRQNKPWKQVWVVADMPDSEERGFPDGIELVESKSLDYYRHLATSKILIDNAFNIEKGAFEKRAGQYVLETMHGSLGIKKIGPEVVNNETRNKRGYQCGEITDYVLSNSDFEDMVYKTSFWRKETIIQTGHARDDIFFCDGAKKAEIKKKVCEYFDVDEDAKMLLYAPTFRNKDESSEYELLSYQKLYDALKDRFGGEWIILERMHHSTKRKKFMWDNVPYMRDANDYPDIQELMVAIDVGVTDYSSWIFDYVLTKKVGFLYVPDLEKYREDRGFYYPITDTPFPIGTTSNELAEKVRAFDRAEYGTAVDKFLHDRGCMEDGHASERIVDLIQNIMDK